ncbi:MAG: hypothetical protein WBI44_08335 [Syntrophaceticus sp.]
MAVVLKKEKENIQEKNLHLVPKTNKVEKVEYEFPYDDMYLLYEHIMNEKGE